MCFWVHDTTFNAHKIIWWPNNIAVETYASTFEARLDLCIQVVPHISPPLVSLHPKSFYHDVHPRKYATSADETDPSPGWPRLPLPAACPSPIEPTAAEIAPAMHTLPWLTGFNSSFTATQVDKHSDRSCWWLPFHLSINISFNAFKVC